MGVHYTQQNTVRITFSRGCLVLHLKLKKIFQLCRLCCDRQIIQPDTFLKNIQDQKKLGKTFIIYMTKIKQQTYM